MNQKEIKNRDTDYLLNSLEFLANYYQRNTSKESLTYGLGIYGRVMDEQNFIKASKKVSLISKPVNRKKITDLSIYALPCVIYLKDNKAAILLNYDKENNNAEVIFSDVSEGKIDISLDELEEQFLSRAIIVKPAYNFENRVNQEVKIDQPQKWFWGTLKKNKDIYVKVIIASIFINLFVIAMPLFIMNVYDRIIPNNGIETLWALAIGIIVVMLFDLVLKTVRSYYLGKASKRSDVVMSNKIFDHLLNIRLEEKPASTGMFVNRVQSFHAVRDFFTTATITAIVDIPFLIIFISLIFYIGGSLGWITVVTILTSLIFSFFMQKPIEKNVKKSSKEEQLKHTTLNETVAGLEIIKSIRGQNRMKTHWDKSMGQTVYFNEKTQLLSQFTNYFISFISQISNILIIIAGVYLAAQGDITTGTIVAAMMLNRRAISPVNHIVSMIIKFDKTKLGIENIDEIMNMQVEKENKSYLSRPELNGDIEFKNISFSYKNKNYNVLKDINLKIKQGERVAILGKIGSGKSTLIKLLQNIYVPTNGSVLIDNTDVRQIDPVDLRKSIGVVPQEPYLFMGSVKDNITIGDPFATDDEILEASRIAGVHDFLSKHESGYDFIVGERGEGLSGGERQAITLARALISKPNLLILDEPTNSMDRQTEKQFIKKLSTVIKDQTLIIITHKLSMLSLVDRVIVLDNTKVIADGPKEVVLKQKEGNDEQ